MAFDDFQLLSGLSGSATASPQVLAMLMVWWLKMRERTYGGYKVKPTSPNTEGLRAPPLKSRHQRITLSAFNSREIMHHPDKGQKENGQ